MKTSRSRSGLLLASLLAMAALAPLPASADTGFSALRLDLSGLESLGPGYVYEGWIIVDGEPLSTGTFMVDAAGNPIIGADGQVSRNYVDMGLYYAFSRNDEWRAQLLQRYAEVMNTVFTEERLLTLFDEMVESVRGEMPRTIDRWNWPSSMDRWEREIATMREHIAQRREGAKNMLQSYYHLSDEEMAALFPNG